MGQKSSKIEKCKQKEIIQKKQKQMSLQNQINSKLKQYDTSIKQKIENNYAISNFNSNTFLAFNIKKKVDSKTDDKFSWLEYAEDECELIYSQKQYEWVEQTLRLLKYMKKDAKVRDFQKSSIVSLIYTIETMTDLDYLVDVPIDQYEDFFQEEELDEIVERQINEYQKTLMKSSQQSLFGSLPPNMDGSGSMNLSNENKKNQGGDIQTPVKIIEYNDNKSQSGGSTKQQNNLFDSIVDKDEQNPSQQLHHNHTIMNLQKNCCNNNDVGNDNKNNIRTLIERTPIFEEELEENIQGTKIDCNLMRSEVFTIMADQNNNILQYNGVMEERQQIRERNTTAITQMNNNTLLLNNAAVVAHQENINNQNNNSSNQNGAISRQSQLQQQQLSDSYVDALKMVNFYKRIAVFLEKSLEEKVNGLRAVQKLYKKYFIKHYSNILFELQKSGVMEVEEKIVDEMLKDIQQFIHFFLYCIIFFYDLDNLLPQKKYSSLVNKENLWNLLINLFFQDTQVYTLCFELTSVSLIDKEKQLQSKMINLEKVLPHHLEIHPRFCLDKKTIEYQQKQKINKQEKERNSQLLKVPNQNNNESQIQTTATSAMAQTNNACHESCQMRYASNNQSLNQNKCKKSENNKEELEMLEEESEFLFNENSLSLKESQFGLQKSLSSHKMTPSSLQSQRSMSIQNKQNSSSPNNDKENTINSIKNNSKIRDSLNRSIFKSNNSVQGTSSSVVIEQKILENKRSSSPLNEINVKCYAKQQQQSDEYVKESKSHHNLQTDKYYNPYDLSMQDEEEKDEILEETCIPKMSSCEDKDSFLKPRPFTNYVQSYQQSSSQAVPQSKQSKDNNNNSQNNQRSSNKQLPSPSLRKQLTSPSNQRQSQKAIACQNLITQQNSLKENRSNSLDEKCPYYKAIKKLKNLQFYNSPVHKMKLLVQCFELIPECVQEFYEQNIGNYEQNLIASDDLINILVFIVLKSKCTQLNTHLKLISSFLTKSTQQSKIGYYCTTLQIVAGYLESDQIYENVESLRTKSECFNLTLFQMNTSFLRKSSVSQNIDITSISKIISAEKLDHSIPQQINQSNTNQNNQSNNNNIVGGVQTNSSNSNKQQESNIDSIIHHDNNNNNSNQINKSYSNQITITTC